MRIRQAPLAPACLHSGLQRHVHPLPFAAGLHAPMPPGCAGMVRSRMAQDSIFFELKYYRHDAQNPAARHGGQQGLLVQGVSQSHRPAKIRKRQNVRSVWPCPRPAKVYVTWPAPDQARITGLLSGGVLLRAMRQAAAVLALFALELFALVVMSHILQGCGPAWRRPAACSS